MKDLKVPFQEPSSKAGGGDVGEEGLRVHAGLGGAQGMFFKLGINFLGIP